MDGVQRRRAYLSLYTTGSDYSDDDVSVLVESDEQDDHLSLSGDEEEPPEGGPIHWEYCSSSTEEERPRGIARPLDLTTNQAVVGSADNVSVLSYEESDIDSEEDDPMLLNDVDVQRARNEIEPLPTREEMLKLILDYMVFQCHRKPAETLCAEFGLEFPHEEFKIMDFRSDINNCILRGDMKTAIEKIEEISPNMLANNQEVRFLVHRQNLVEMIREGETEQPFGVCENKPRLGFDMERPTDDSPFHTLYGQEQRVAVAKAVNRTLMTSLNRHSESRLAMMFKLLTWAKCELISLSTDDSYDPLEVAHKLFGEKREIDAFANSAIDLDDPCGTRRNPRYEEPIEETSSP
ncbi:unnamed protein product [Caenorhabditis auriculariae]|uniref:CTLH domain-containing protein n=1 Tax=Caenorhabditis auriculariae TaxID=2777116 RepID=A0A8S1HP47_9PELO|nr:unnamed protein product [Caenorhabditis auriculariae]